MSIEDPVHCHFCRFEAPTLTEVWRHQASEHPDEDAEEVAEHADDCQCAHCHLWDALS